MVKLQSHKKTIIESVSRRQASTDAKQAVLSSRDPRTVCMTEHELAYLRASFRVNRWPERAEKERLARLIGKYVGTFLYFFRLRLTSSKVLYQRQKLANVEKVLKHPATPETPMRYRNLNIVQMTGTTSTKIKQEEHVGPRAQDTFMCKQTPEIADISVEDGARLLLGFVESVRAAHTSRTPSP